MPRLKENQLPSYRLHKQSGQAIVTLSGKDVLLGKWAGLAIAKALTEMHGGSITAASEGRDRGAVFTHALRSEPAHRQILIHGYAVRDGAIADPRTGAAR
jgi:hypothetical protein